jgi:hypothetical protein
MRFAVNAVSVGQQKYIPKPYAIGLEFATNEEAATFSAAYGLEYDPEDEECVWFGFYDTLEEAEFVKREMIKGWGTPEAKCLAGLLPEA